MKSIDVQLEQGFICAADLGTYHPHDCIVLYIIQTISPFTTTGLHTGAWVGTK